MFPGVTHEPVHANVIALDDLLAPFETPFRAAVREALTREGFELTGGLPNLQLARDIRHSIAWVKEGHSMAWESFESFLQWAERKGVLVDLGLEPIQLFTA